MAILFSFLSAAYAAFAIRLVVRITNKREKRPKLMVALTIAPFLYALSFGPMASLGRNGFLPESLGWLFGWFYEPLILFLNNAPDAVVAPMGLYFTAWP